VAKVLLDTQIFLWAITADKRLKPAHRKAFEDEASELFLSVASVWEILIKHRLGKLPLPEPVTPYLNKHLSGNRIGLLQIRMAHFAELETLPTIHRDPFDRMIVAQARAENMALLTTDARLGDYGVRRL
jgi:PIN domain nuclease of toxin-antitoxin system